VISWLGIRDSFFDPFIEMEHAALLFQHIRFLKGYPPFQAYLESNGSQRPYSGFEDHKNTFNNGLYSLQLLIGEREGKTSILATSLDHSRSSFCSSISSAVRSLHYLRRGHRLGYIIYQLSEGSTAHGRAI
jgi:hypothetical protein